MKEAVIKKAIAMRSKAHAPFSNYRVGAAVETESGEIIDAIKEGFISESDIVADLKELVCDDKIGRRNTTDITLFKSVGTALEDLAAATLILQNA